MNKLSEEHIWHIFTFLPPKDLVKAGEVCKNWHRISNDDVLWKHAMGYLFEMSRTESGKLRNWKGYFQEWAKKAKLYENNLNSSYFQACHKQLGDWNPLKVHNGPGKDLYLLTPENSVRKLNFIGSDEKRKTDLFIKSHKIDNQQVNEIVVRRWDSDEIVFKWPCPKLTQKQMIVLDDWIFIRKPDAAKATLINLDNGNQIKLKKYPSSNSFEILSQYKNYLAMASKNSVNLWNLNKPGSPVSFALKEIKDLEIYKDKLIILTKKALSIRSVSDQKKLYKIAAKKIVAKRENDSLVFSKDLELFLINLNEPILNPTKISDFSWYVHSLQQNCLESRINRMYLKDGICCFSDTNGNVAYQRIGERPSFLRVPFYVVRSGDRTAKIIALFGSKGIVVAFTSNRELELFNMDRQICKLPFSNQFKIKGISLTNSKLDVMTIKRIFRYDLAMSFKREGNISLCQKAFKACTIS